MAQPEKINLKIEIMKTRSKVILASLAIAAVATVGSYFAASANAQVGWMSKSKKAGFGRLYDQERHQKMVDAVNNGDYEAWKSIVGDRPISEKINSENFSKYCQMKKLLWEGKFEEAKTIAEELGLNGYGFGIKKTMKGAGRGNCNCNCGKTQTQSS